ncbi:MAG TPA: hypothetical protein PKK00_06055 [Bacteroidales bacterium]|nr:hypothetical protein [Bacteroidales bacterium]HPS16854.1 hypothetical protein [Bacteroidales bacterium]
MKMVEYKAIKNEKPAEAKIIKLLNWYSLNEKLRPNPVQGIVKAASLLNKLIANIKLMVTPAKLIKLFNQKSFLGSNNTTNAVIAGIKTG